MGASMRVVVNNGLGAYVFLCSARTDVGEMKIAIGRVLPIRPCEMLLYHNGVPLTNDDLDLRRLYWPPMALQLQMQVTVFVPR